MMSSYAARRIAAGVYRVEHDGHGEIVYVAESSSERWAFWNGRVFRESIAGGPMPLRRESGTRSHAAQPLSSPMPATVIKVLVSPGSAVKKGDTILVLEAMKMELPLRSPSDGIVKTVCCREGDLVQPDATLVELE